jgi:hypothetical protein
MVEEYGDEAASGRGGDPGGPAKPGAAGVVIFRWPFGTKENSTEVKDGR